jgi:hypothetical protein
MHIQATMSETSSLITTRMNTKRKCTVHWADLRQKSAVGEADDSFF